MIKVSRYLKTPSSKASPIWFRVNFKGKNIRLSSGITLETKYWNSKSKTISISKTNVKEVNSELLRLEQLIYSIAETVTKEKGSMDLKELSSTYKQELKGESTDKNNLLFRSAFDMYIDHCLNSSVKKDGTAAVYKTVRKQIISFEESMNKPYLLTELNRNYFENFRLYLQEKYGLANITVNKYFRVLKSLSRFLLQRGIAINSDIFDITIKYTDTNKVVISNDDMAKLKSVNLKTQNQNKYRDLFLILCHIGIRVSDLHNLNESNIDFKNNLVNIYTKKTSTPVSIPVPNDIILLLEQYFIKSNIGLSHYSGHRLN
ncbi:MAG: phage integrase SAM-like domain-containing protein [Romboutsia sp.]|nr:phage integrase SAM-like domain-containing protein [Romboutsia sp.]